MTLRVLIRGGGDLASGVAWRCFRSGWEVCITELPSPLAVRRTVSFSQAIYDGSISIEGVRGVRVSDYQEILSADLSQFIPVIADPDCDILADYLPQVLVEARMAKQQPHGFIRTGVFIIGLGPGFIVGGNCQAVVETLRGHHLGRVYWEGSAAANTGIPDRVGNVQAERVIRAPKDGLIHTLAAIGSHVNAGEVIADVSGQNVLSPIAGVLRGLIQDGISIRAGTKIGDVDPRDDPSMCWLLSDKALAVGGGVLEAILSWPALRGKLYG